MGGVGQAVKQIAYQAGAVYGGLKEAYPLQAGLDFAKIALPMVQYILMMVIIVCLPVIIVISGYSVTTVITAAFALFAFQFMSFWWELSRFLNSRLVDMLYDSDAAKLDWMVASNITDKLVLQFVEGALFFVIPVVWIGIMAWTGNKIGAGIGGAMKDGVSSSTSAGKSGGSDAQNSAGGEAKKAYDKTE